MMASMRASIRQWLPETFLVVLALFFALRELGTFPAPWEDDSLYMITAKMIASGQGYVLPILQAKWAYPYLLSVGLGVLLPTAAAIRLLGFSVAHARIVPVAYLLGSCVLFYLIARKAAGLWSASFSTALLVSFSAFINDGKPVLGTVPAFFWLLLGLLTLDDCRRGAARSIGGGVCIGLAMLCKLTFSLALLPFAAAWLLSRRRGDRIQARSLLLAMSASLAVFLPWIAIEAAHEGEFADFIGKVFESSTSPLLSLLRGKIEIFSQWQYV